MGLRCVLAPLLTSFITCKPAFSLSLPAEGPFKTLNYDDIVERLHHLATTYPQLVQVGRIVDGIVCSFTSTCM